MRRSGEGWIIFVALLGFIGIAIFLVARFGGGEQRYPPGTSYSPKFDGTKALYELLGRYGFKVERYGGTEYEYPQQACMVIVQEVEMEPGSMFGGGLDPNAVRLWVEKGGRLVVAASLGSMLIETFRDDFGPLGPQPPPPARDVAVFKKKGGEGEVAAIWRSYRPGMIYKLPADRPQLWRSVGAIEAGEEMMDAPVGGHGLLYAGNPPMPVVLYRRQGEGEVYFLLRPELLVNGWLAREDNHRLALALFARAAQGRPLYFDEHLHGYRQAGNSAGALLTGTPGGRLLLCLAAAVALLFAGAAIKPARSAPPPVPARRQAAEIVLAQASLYKRAGVRKVIAENLVDGVRRAYMLANHLAAPPGNAELLEWLKGAAEQGRAAAAGSALTTFLETQAPFRSPLELLRLAQACDRARRLL